jgi:hypothetical protein
MTDRDGARHRFTYDTAIAKRAAATSGRLASAAEAIEAFLTFDVIIVSGMVLIAVSTVAVGLKGIVDGAEINQLPDKADEVTGALCQAFMSGIANGKPPSDAVAMPGYEWGKKRYQEISAEILKKVPDASEEDIVYAIAQLVDNNHKLIWIL